MKKSVVLLCAMLLFFICVGMANATLIGFTTDRTFATIDPNTGTVTPIGDPTGIINITMGSLASDPINHNYYVQASYTGESSKRLFTIDTQTGSITADPIVTSKFELVQYEALIEPVPEPTTILLFGSGLACLAAFRRRRFKK